MSYPDRMVDLISFPFRVGSSGTVVVSDDAGVDYLGEELAQLIQTHPGERELVPAYGLNDPTYTRFDTAMLTAQCQLFGPPVTIDSVDTRYLDDTTQDVVVTFRPRSTTTDSATGNDNIDGG